MADYVVIRSELIETPEEAWAYYQAKFVGTRQILVRAAAVTIQFPDDEIHLFTEELKAGHMPSPDKIVLRPKSREVRYFAKARAKLLDRLVPTLSNPTGSVAAKDPGATMVFGPVDRDGQRMAVVVRPRGDCWVVRTAYPLTLKQFASYKRSGRSLPWPP